MAVVFGKSLNQYPSEHIDNDSGNKVSSIPKSSLGHKKGIAIAFLNVNSLLCRHDQIASLTLDHGLHVLALNETKLDNNIKDEIIYIDGFKLRRADINRSGGGVAIYINNTFKLEVREDLPDNSLELLCIKIAPVQSRPFNVPCTGL